MGLKHFFEDAFQDHLTLIQVCLFVGLILTLWFVELVVSMKSWKDKWRHTAVNLLFVSTALPIQLGLTFIVLLTAEWVTDQKWGILYLFPWSGTIWIKFIFGFFLLDFFEYFYHRMMHMVNGLWRFHMVHHSDTEVDVSTTVREHPGETVVRVLFLAFVVLLSGASLGLLVLRQTIQTISNLTSHTHLKLSPRTDKLLNWLFITPNLHHVHHHYELPYTDCNFGDVLSIWDRIFGTYSEINESQLHYGLDTFDSPESPVFLSLIKAPLIKGHEQPKE